MIIEGVKALKITNSRGEDSIAVIIDTKAGRVISTAPSGKSRGKHEAEPFSKKGIDFSISFANAIGKKIIIEKISFSKFEDLEKFESLIKQYDKTSNWSMIGGNTVFAFEASILKAIALSNNMELWQLFSEKKSLPMPVGNCIGGGQHIIGSSCSGSEPGSKPKSDFQEFLFIPKTKNFYDSYYLNLQAYKEAKQIIIQKDRLWRGELTDEKAIASSLKTEEILGLMNEISKKISQKFGSELRVGVDCASSTFFKDGKYHYKNPKSEKNSEKQIEYILDLIKDYNLFYIEDPLDEDDFEGFAKLTKKAKCLIVGDDLTCTQPERLEKAIKHKSINAVIVKPNQNGSLIETKKFVDIAKKNNIIPIISHRSGETMDSTIADLAVGWQIPFIKTGILGKERFAKLHRLLRIERA
jgi:enolase